MQTRMASPRWLMSRVSVLVVALTVLLCVLADPRSSRGQSPTPAGTDEPKKELVETVVVTAPAAGVTDYASGRETIFDAFYRTGLDSSKAYTVSNLSIRRDTTTFLLK